MAGWPAPKVSCCPFPNEELCLGSVSQPETTFPSPSHFQLGTYDQLSPKGREHWKVVPLEPQQWGSRCASSTHCPPPASGTQELWGSWPTTGPKVRNPGCLNPHVEENCWKPGSPALNCLLHEPGLNFHVLSHWNFEFYLSSQLESPLLMHLIRSLDFILTANKCCWRVLGRGWKAHGEVFRECCGCCVGPRGKRGWEDPEDASTLIPATVTELVVTAEVEGDQWIWDLL